MKTRRQNSAEFKAKVAQEAIKEERTLNIYLKGGRYV